MPAVELISGYPSLYYITDQDQEQDCEPSKSSVGGDLILQHGLRISETNCEGIEQSYEAFSVADTFPPLQLIRDIYRGEGNVFASRVEAHSFHGSLYSLYNCCDDLKDLWTLDGNCNHLGETAFPII